MSKTISAKVGVVLAAAGSGQRLGFGVPKAEVLCAGSSLLEHALHGVLESDAVHEVCVVVPAGDTRLRTLIDGMESKAALSGIVLSAVDGGAERPDSVRAGLAGLSADIDYVLVHDAARALTPPAVFLRVVEALRGGAEAVVPVVEVVDTIKTVADGRVTGTPARSALRAVQTPQGFTAKVLKRAHSGSGSGVTDDAMLIEALGIAVNVVDGAVEAFKVTTPQDLLLAATIIQQRTVQQKDITQEGTE